MCVIVMEYYTNNEKIYLCRLYAEALSWCPSGFFGDPLL